MTIIALFFPNPASSLELPSLLTLPILWDSPTAA